MLIGRVSGTGLSIRRGERQLFANLDLDVQAGQALSLVGANGSGKTSLLRALAGLVHPAAGSIRFEARDASRLDADEARSADLHYFGHQDGLKASRALGEELAFAAAWTGGDRKDLGLAIERLELGPLLRLEGRRLSAGQKRRAALARAVACPRALWLLDEPLAPLDTRMRLIVGQIMTEHLNRGGLIVAAVHDALPLESRMLEITP